MKPVSLALAFCGLAAGITQAFSAPPERRVSARLTGRDALVTWEAPADGAAGHIVEYINHPTDEWVILGFFPAGKNTFTHPRLAPGTPYAYRVRAFYGPTSAPVAVTVAEGLSDQAYADAYALPEDYSWAPPQKIPATGAGVVAPKSIRAAATRAAAAPGDLKAEIIRKTVSGFRLTWNDRSSDEEGFLLERIDSATDFTVCAVVEPNVTAFGWALEPPARTGRFRVRAYYYGPASKIARIVTAPEPDDGPAKKPST